VTQVLPPASTVTVENYQILLAAVPGKGTGASHLIFSPVEAKGILTPVLELKQRGRF